MVVKNFEYAAPASLAEATKLLAGATGTARILAGGTDLIVQLREHLKEADLVVDVKKIPELMELKLSAQGLRLGAAVPCYVLYDNADVSAKYSALTDAARIIGGWQIQSRASIGGNLCNSSPAGDSLPALIALKARCLLAGPAGTREVAAEEFCTGPGKNVLQKGEVLAALEFPATGAKTGSAYQRFIPRNEMDIAVVGVGASVTLNAAGDKIESARIALGAVSATPKFAAEASQWLAGQPATRASFEQAGQLAKKVATPISDMRGTAEYRLHLVGVLTARTLADAVERARK